MKNLNNLYESLQNDKFYKEYILKDSALLLFNVNTADIVENKYNEVFGILENELTINIMLMNLLAYFKCLGHSIHNPKQFLNLCEN